MDTLLTPLLAFIVSFSNLPGINWKDVPPIYPLTVVEMKEKFNNGNIAAAYEYDENIIYIRDDLDVTTPIGRSFLLHELVHVLQYRANGTSIYATCDKLWATEKEAYVLQDKYLAHTNQMFRAGGILRFFNCV